MTYIPPRGLTPPEIPNQTQHVGTATCIDPLHFKLVDGKITPQPWTQWRKVATAGGIVGGTSASYPVIGGSNVESSLGTVTASWTNDSPIHQMVYALVTRGGCRVTMQATSRAYLVTYHGEGSSADTEVSKCGCGLMVGKDGVFANDAFGVIEVRQHSSTIPLLPSSGGWRDLAPGGTYTASARVDFKSDNWQSAPIEGGKTGGESSYTDGGTQVDIFAVPVLV